MKNGLKGIASFVIVAFAIIGFFTVVYFLIPDSSSNEQQGLPIEKNTEFSDSTRVAEISYNLSLGLPSPIYSTKNLMFRVGFDVESELYKRANYNYMINKTSNVIIYNTVLDSGRLVFDFPSVVSEIDYPSKKEEINQKYILYKSISTDSDQDGILTAEDNAVLFISDLSGGNIQKLTPDSLSVNDYKVLNNYKKLYVSLSSKESKLDSKSKKSRKRKYLHIYDLGTRKKVSDENLKAILNGAKDVIIKNVE